MNAPAENILPVVHCMPLSARYLLWICLALHANLAHAEDRFEVWLRDGQRHGGQNLAPLYQNPQDRLKLDNKELGAAGNPVLTVHCALVPNLEGPGAWIEFANGDQVPGRITTWLPPQSAVRTGSQLETLLVALEAAGDFTSTSIAVRPEAVKRVWSGTRAGSKLAPGTVITIDGRQISARGLRFGSSGLECLTEAGIEVLPYDLVRDAAFVLPPYPLDTVADDLWAKDQDPLPGIVRFKTSRGATVTAGNQVLQRGKDKDNDKQPATIHLQPNWSLQTLQLVTDRLRWISWRSTHELPLTGLTHEFATTTKAAQRWAPQRHRNVQGSELRCPGLSAEQGWGVHSGTRITVNLPPQVERFRGWVGIDQVCGRGGCARAKILQDRPDGAVLWQSDFLLGGQKPQAFELDIRQCKSLVLVVDEAHDSRPAGADPWDIRDHVDWLWPTLSRSATKPEELNLARYEPLSRWIPALAGFESAAAQRDQAFLRSVMTPRGYRFALVPTAEDQKDAGLRFEKKVSFVQQNSLLTLTAGQDGTPGRHQNVSVECNEATVPSSPSGSIPVSYHFANKASFGERDFLFGNQLGQEATVALRVQPDQTKPGPQSGVVLETVAWSAAFNNLPADGKFLVPELPLTNFTPLKFNKDWTWAAGKTYKNEDLKIRGVVFPGGTALPAGAELNLPIDPAWQRFVAVIGKTDPSYGKILLTILADDEVLWQSEKQLVNSSQPEQLDLPIPAGHKILTLRVMNKESIIALGNAGFMTK